MKTINNWVIFAAVNSYVSVYDEIETDGEYKDSKEMYMCLKKMRTNYDNAKRNSHSVTEFKYFTNELEKIDSAINFVYAKLLRYQKMVKREITNGILRGLVKPENFTSVAADDDDKF